MALVPLHRHQQSLIHLKHKPQELRQPSPFLLEEHREEQNRATGKSQGLKGVTSTFQQALERRWLRARGGDLLGAW